MINYIRYNSNALARLYHILKFGSAHIKGNVPDNVWTALKSGNSILCYGYKYRIVWLVHIHLYIGKNKFRCRSGVLHRIQWIFLIFRSNT